MVQRAEALAAAPVLVLLLQLWAVRLGRAGGADCAAQGTARRAGQVDLAGALPARLRRLPDPAGARGRGDQHVLRLPERRQDWGHRRRDRVHPAGLHADAAGELPVQSGRVGEQVLQCEL